MQAKKIRWPEAVTTQLEWIDVILISDLLSFYTATHRWDTGHNCVVVLPFW